MTGSELQEMFNTLGGKIDCLREEIKSLNGHQSKEQPQEYMTTKEVCSFLQVSSMTLRRWSHAGILSPKRAGNKVYYSRANIEAALQDKAV